MLQIEYPWLLLLLPLPWLVYRYAPPYRQHQPAVRVPYFHSAVKQLNLTARDGANVIAQPGHQRLLVMLIWSLLTVALARPVWLGTPISQERSARDLILAVDISPSMSEAAASNTVDNIAESSGKLQNSQPGSSRLEVVQQVVDQFIVRRNKDRVGLLLFAGQAYPQAPLTMDHSVVRTLLKESRVGFAGPNTAIGDAVGLAIKLFAASEAEEKILILLTDGNDNGSSMPPLKAAQIAADESIVIHTIGVGDSRADEAIKLDTATLMDIAKSTGGQFYRANNQAELQEIYHRLDQLTPTRVKTLSYRPTHQLYHWLLTAVAALLSVGIILQRVLCNDLRSRTNN